MKFLFLLLVLSSCNFMQPQALKNTEIPSMLGLNVFTKKQRSLSSVIKLRIGKVYKIAFPDKLSFQKKNQKIAQCNPIFGARVELLELKGDQALLDYTNLMEVKGEEFCQDGHVFMSTALLKRTANLFTVIQIRLFALATTVGSIINGISSHSKVAVKGFDPDLSKTIKIGDLFKIKSKKVLPLGIKNRLTLKVEELDFMKKYLNANFSLRMGKFCSAQNLHLKVVGFHSNNTGSNKNIFVKVVREKTSNIFKLVQTIFPKKCPVDTHFFVAPEELLKI